MTHRTPWYVTHYGRHVVIERYAGIDVEFLHGFSRGRPEALFKTLEEAEAVANELNSEATT